MRKFLTFVSVLALAVAAQAATVAVTAKAAGCCPLCK